MTEMHDVVEMLLNRMKDYPEDFVMEPNSYEIKQTKWQKAWSMVQGVASTQEREALDIRLEEAQRAVYMGAALKTILSDESEEDHSRIYTTKTVGFGQAAIKAEGSKIDYIEARKQKEYALNEYANAYPIGSAQR